MKTPKFTDGHRFRLGAYRPAVKTNLKATFRRERDRLAEEAVKHDAKVKPIRGTK